MKTRNTLLYSVFGLAVLLNIGLYCFYEELGFNLHEFWIFWWVNFQVPISIFQVTQNYYLKRKYQDSAAHFVPKKHLEGLKQKKVFAGFLLIFALGIQVVAVLYGDFKFAMISALIGAGVYIYFLSIFSPGVLGTNIRNVWLYPTRTLFHKSSGELYEFDNAQIEDVQIIDEQLVIKYKAEEKIKEFRMNSGYFSKNEFQAVMRAIQRNQ